MPTLSLDWAMPAIWPSEKKNNFLFNMFNLLILVNRFYEYLYVVAISSYKFLFAGPVAVASGFGYWESSICLAIGGVLGFFLFYYFSAELILFFNRWFPRSIHKRHPGWVKKNRRRLAFKKYIIPLLLVIGPSLLSIPLTAFAVRRWMDKRNAIIVYFCLSIIIWAFVFGTLAHFNIL